MLTFHQAGTRPDTVQLMVDHAPQVALAVCDARSSRLLQANARFLDMVECAHGYPRDTILGRPWREVAFFDAGHDAVALFEAVRGEGRSTRAPGVRLRLSPEDEESAWDWWLAPVRASADDAIELVVVSGIEVTERVREAEGLRQLDRVKDEFLSLASHELRTPLMPLAGHAEMLAESLRSDSVDAAERTRRIGHHAAKILKQVRRLERLISDLLDLSRLQSGKFSLNLRPVNLTQVVSQAVDEARMMAPERTIGLDLPAEPVIMERGDRGRLGQVMTNLLSNALVHAAASPRIDVRLSLADGFPGADEAEATAAVIEVADQGPGIPPEEIGSIFARFHQVPGRDRHGRPGLGLGLYIVRQIVEQHGGKVTVESAIGQGSTFTVRLPLARG